MTYFFLSLWLCKTHKAFPWAWLIFSVTCFHLLERGVHVSSARAHASLVKMTEEVRCVTRTSLGELQRFFTEHKGKKHNKNPDPVSWKALVFCLQVFISRNQEYWWAKWLQSSSPQLRVLCNCGLWPHWALPLPRPLRHIPSSAFCIKNGPLPISQESRKR